MKQRRRIRIVAQKDATVEGRGGKMRAVVDNISLKGCLVRLPGAGSFAERQSVALWIHLEPGNPEFDIEVEGVVVRAAEDHLAVDFKELAPESFPHLLRLVQYNAEDPEEIEQELGTTAYDLPE